MKTRIAVLKAGYAYPEFMKKIVFVSKSLELPFIYLHPNIYYYPKQYMHSIRWYWNEQVQTP